MPKIPPIHTQRQELAKRWYQQATNVGKKNTEKKNTVIKTQKKNTGKKKHKVYVRSIYLLTISQIWLVYRFLALYNIFLTKSN